MYAQIIDDTVGKNSRFQLLQYRKEVKAELEKKRMTLQQQPILGTVIAKRAIEKRYHNSCLRQRRFHLPG